MEHTPREYLALQLLVNISCYVGDWHDECRLFVRSAIVRMPPKWSDDLARQIAGATAGQVEKNVIPALKAKQCMYYLCGVLCFGGSAALSAADIACLCKLQILAHHGRMFSKNKKLEEEIAPLLVQCLNVLSGRSFEIIQQASKAPTFITAAVRHVLEGTPEHLSWIEIPDKMACFKAESDGHLYTVNLLTGVVLFDGAPPTLLPADIVQKPQFQRVFGSNNFEVATTSNGIFRTVRAIGGRL